MYAEKMVLKETLKSLCCSYGWCYAIFWGFDQINSLLLTFNDAYYEQQMGILIDSMLLQAHVLGGGIIGQTAFMKNHRWVYSDALDERQNSLGSFDNLEVLQDGSEFLYQFSMGIKTITVISVEPWGVLQLGSFHKNLETKCFVDQVKELFRDINNLEEIKILGQEPHSDNPFVDPSVQFNSVLSGCISNSDGFVETDHSLVLPSPIQIETGDFFDSSLLAPSWPHLASSLEDSMMKPIDHEFFDGSNIAVSKHGLDDDFSQWFSPIYNSQNLPTDSLQSSVSHAQDSVCIAEKHVGSTSNSLFSKLGLDGLLNGTASTSHSPLSQSRFEGQSSSHTKRRKTDNNFSWSHKFESFCSEGSAKDPHSCGDDSCVIDAGKTSPSNEQAKTKKKKAKPGTKPRPKDRQMIQDRLAELRELIPNGDKMSIDRLLERTIRHLNFMQSLTRHAESLKQMDKAKSRDGNECGATWACEVGDQAMECPLIVEDLSIPGQMLIEMVCEDHGFFLEIVDVIRSFGLIIHKGVMEVRVMNKIWAHFMVEAEEDPNAFQGKRCVSRHEIFTSLIRHLQMAGQGGSYANVISWANDVRASASLPVNLNDALQCANL